MFDRVYNIIELQRQIDKDISFTDAFILHVKGNVIREVNRIEQYEQRKRELK